MDRREFLKSIGLGGVALTFPKPLSVVAARMADLAAPPLHVGRAEIGTLSDQERGNFVMTHVSIEPIGILKRERYDDLLDRWNLCARLMNAEDKSRNGILYFNARLAYFHIRPIFPGQATRIPQIFTETMAWMWNMGDRMEFWIVPNDLRNLPRFPLPEMRIWLEGWHHKRVDQIGSFQYMGFHAWCRVQSARLDRARAIEMGLVGPEEPEDDLSEPAKEDIASAQ